MSYKIKKLAVIIVSAVVIFTVSNLANADDRYVGYYYPQVESEETYQAPLPVFSGVTRLSRVGFVTGLDQQQKKRPYHQFIICLQKVEMRKN